MGGFEGILVAGISRDLLLFNVIQRISRTSKAFEEMSKYYRFCKAYQGILKDFNEVQWISRLFKVFQEMLRDFKVIQGNLCLLNVF